MNAEEHRRPPSWKLLWFGLLAAPTAWALHDLTASAFAGLACSDGDMGLGGLSAGGVRVVLALFTLLLIGVAVAGGLGSWRTWKVLNDDANPAWSQASRRVEFMAMAGLIVTAVGVVGLIYAGLPTAFVDDCGKLP